MFLKIYKNPKVTDIKNLFYCLDIFCALKFFKWFSYSWWTCGFEIFNS